jgi:predicted RNase H-like HicB family nuclease
MESGYVRLKKSGSRNDAEATYALRILFIEGDGGWSAQCLEYDIATQAETLADLFYEVERVLVAHVALATENGREPFAGIPSAPEKYWRIFERSRISMERPAAGLKARKSAPLRIRPTIRVAERAA